MEGTHIGYKVSAKDHQTTFLFCSLNGILPRKAARRKIRPQAPNLAQIVITLICLRFSLRGSSYARLDDMKVAEVGIGVAKT